MEAITHSVAYSCDILCITETHLQPNSDTSYLTLQGYQEAIRLDRSDGPWGGVAIYPSNNLVVKLCPDYIVFGLELLWVYVRQKNRKFLLGVCYRKPSATMEFWDKLQDSIDFIKTQYDGPVILCGDLNADPNTINGSKLQNFITSNHFTKHVNTPTRITPNSATILEQFISNCPDMISDISVLPPVSSNDHCTVEMTLTFKHSSSFTYQRQVWSYKTADIRGFKQALQAVDWDLCFHHKNIDLVYREWTKIVLRVAKQFIPNKVITVRLADKPWYNGDLRRAKRKKDRAHSKAKMYNTVSVWAKYKKLRNEYCNMVKYAKVKYAESFSCLVEESGGITNKKFWHFAKLVLGKSADCCLPPLKQPDDPNTYVDTLDKAELLNNYFVSKSNLDDSSVHIPDVLNYKTKNRLSNLYVTHNEVIDVLTTLNINKATGPDSVSPYILRSGAEQLAPSLARLFNYSLNICQLPEA